MNKSSSMNSPQEKKQGIVKVASLQRVLFFVSLVASVKISLLVGILFFPSELPHFEFTTVKEFVVKQIQGEKQPSVVELKAQARLKAQRENATPLVSSSVTPATPAPVETVAANEVPTTNAIPENTTVATVNVPARNIQTAIPPIPLSAEGAAILSATPIKSKALFSINTAYAVENIPPAPNPAAAQPNASPLVPQVKPMQNPVGIEKFQRPDTITANGLAKTPDVQNPYLPTDTLGIKTEELNRREQELLALQQQMDARMKEMRGIEGNLSNLVGDAGNAETDKYKHLIDVYVNMKPRQAAAALAGVDQKVAVKILSGMRAKQAGSILSYMEPASAIVLSEMLAKIGS